MKILNAKNNKCPICKSELINEWMCNPYDHCFNNSRFLGIRVSDSFFIFLGYDLNILLYKEISRINNTSQFDLETILLKNTNCLNINSSTEDVINFLKKCYENYIFY